MDYIDHSNGYRSMVNLPADIWKEVLQEWIAPELVMKGISRMDVALRNRGLREIWWRDIRNVQWSFVVYDRFSHRCMYCRPKKLISEMGSVSIN